MHTSTAPRAAAVEHSFRFLLLGTVALTSPAQTTPPPNDKTVVLDTFQVTHHSEQQRWAEVVKASGVKLE